jgi:hypothetical protein
MRTEMMNKIIESRSREMAGKIRNEIRDAREEGDRLQITGRRPFPAWRRKSGDGGDNGRPSR